MLEKKLMHSQKYYQNNWDSREYNLFEEEIRLQ